jgi:hypothetical protein
MITNRLEKHLSEYTLRRAISSHMRMVQGARNEHVRIHVS